MPEIDIQNEVGPHLPRLLVAQPIAFQDAGLILHEHVAQRDEVLGRLDSARRAEVGGGAEACCGRGN